eukprot:GDKI01029811.1.p1 GENE.GDKI01029811.1~~GDKI01029811.1.p1  ORF type:complete len:298 (-),score=56.35 GDKI01029811.1:161-1054(-)
MTVYKVVSSFFLVVVAFLLPLADSVITKCDENCSKCHLQDWNLEWVCYECKAGYKLWVDKCVEPCGSGKFQFGNTPGNSCFPCAQFCAECVGTRDFQCTKCEDGWQLDKRGVCVKQCASNEYPLADGMGCGKCHESCETCLSGFITGCTSCNSTAGLNVVDGVTQSGICVEFCEPHPTTGRGRYKETPKYAFCKYCAPACKKCLGQRKCLECFDSYSLSNGICYAGAANAEDKRFAAFIGEALYDVLFNKTADKSGIVVPQYDPSNYQPNSATKGSPAYALMAYLNAYNDLYAEEER